MVHAVASEGQITRLNRGAKGRPHEIDRDRDRLRPECIRSHRVVDLSLVGDEAVFLDQVACKLGETITLMVDGESFGPRMSRASQRPARKRRSSRTAS